MTLTEARKEAKRYSANGFNVYIVASIHFVLNTDRFEVEQNGYTLSGWRDGAAVESWVNGKYAGRP